MFLNTIYFGGIRPVLFSLIFFLLMTFPFTSCTTYKNVAYFTDFADTAKHTTVQTIPFKSPVIQPDDLLTITIQTIDAEITTLLNSANTPAQSAASGSVLGGQQLQYTPGYLVDKNGEVEIPFAGKIKLQGYTTVEAREVIRTEISKFVKDPIVNVKFANFKITVLGEVLKPATYIMPTEKVTVFDALGQAGDLTIYGRRENVLVIRDSVNNQKSMVHLNLNTKDIISSPYYYLRPNDVVYVEPNKAKAAGSDAVRNRNITIIASALSVLLVIASRIK
jgi:polysaccharide export outer membrane protein